MSPSNKYQQTQSTQQTLWSLPLDPEKYSLAETGPSNITNTQKGVPVTEHPAQPTQHQCIWTTDSIPLAIQTHGFLDEHIAPITTTNVQTLQNMRKSGNQYNFVSTSCTDDIPTRAVVLAMLLMFLPTTSTSSHWVPLPKPLAQHSPIRYQYHQVFVVSPAKTRKSCQRWSMALIQQQWDNAWDLTAH